MTNRQSMAIVIASRIQDDFSAIRPSLLCVNTVRRPFKRPADRWSTLPDQSPQPQTHTQVRRNQFIP